MRPDQPILEKIKKLLALADGNQNEHEREVSMQFAMDLLAKHNLTISEIQGAGMKIEVEEIEGDFRLEPWIHQVLGTACTLYYTDYYASRQWNSFRGTSRDVPVFVGTADNIAVTMEVATWLINSIRLESNRLYKSAYERRSFRVGAADRLLMRAIDIVVEEKHSLKATPGTSLMVIRNKLERANEEHLASLDLRQTKRRSSYVSANAYSQGEAYGNQVNLNRQAKTTTDPTRRLPVFN